MCERACDELGVVAASKSQACGNRASAEAWKSSRRLGQSTRCLSQRPAPGSSQLRAGLRPLPGPGMLTQTSRVNPARQAGITQHTLVTTGESRLVHPPTCQLSLSLTRRHGCRLRDTGGRLQGSRVQLRLTVGSMWIELPIHLPRSRGQAPPLLPQLSADSPQAAATWEAALLRQLLSEPETQASAAAAADAAVQSVSGLPDSIACQSCLCPTS